MIYLNFEQVGDKYHLSADIPANTSAVVAVPQLAGHELVAVKAFGGPITVYASLISHDVLNAAMANDTVSALDANEWEAWSAGTVSVPTSDYIENVTALKFVTGGSACKVRVVL